MIILTDKMLVIPVGISPNYAGAGKSDIKIQDSKDVTITENGSTTVVPDENFDVLTKVNITTDVNPALEDKSVEITENGDYNYTASAPYYGIGNFNVKVNVQWPVESSKTVNPSFNEDITVLPSEGFDAMSSVIVKKAVPNLEDKNVEINENGDYSFSKSAPYDGIGNLNVKVNVQENKIRYAIRPTTGSPICPFTNVLLTDTSWVSLDFAMDTSSLSKEKACLFGISASSLHCYLNNGVLHMYTGEEVPMNKQITLDTNKHTLEFGFTSKADASGYATFKVVFDGEVVADVSVLVPKFNLPLSLFDIANAYDGTYDNYIAASGIIYLVNTIGYTSVNNAVFDLFALTVYDKPGYYRETINAFTPSVDSNNKPIFIDNITGEYQYPVSGTYSYVKIDGDIRTEIASATYTMPMSNDFQYFRASEGAIVPTDIVLPEHNRITMYVKDIEDFVLESDNSLDMANEEKLNLVRKKVMIGAASEMIAPFDHYDYERDMREMRVDEGNTAQLADASGGIYYKVDGHNGFSIGTEYGGTPQKLTSFSGEHIIKCGVRMAGTAQVWKSTSIDSQDEAHSLWNGIYPGLLNEFKFAPLCIFGTYNEVEGTTPDYVNSLGYQNALNQIGYKTGVRYAVKQIDIEEYYICRDGGNIVDKTVLRHRLVTNTDNNGVNCLFDTMTGTSYYPYNGTLDVYTGPAEPEPPVIPDVSILTDTYIKPSAGAIVPTDIKFTAYTSIIMDIKDMDNFDEVLDSTVTGEAALDVVRSRVMIGAQPNVIAPFNHLDYERQLPGLDINNLNTGYLGDSSIGIYFHGAGYNGYSIIKQYQGTPGTVLPSLTGEHTVTLALRPGDSKSIWKRYIVDNQPETDQLCDWLWPNIYEWTDSRMKAPICIFGTYNFDETKTPDDVIAMGYQNALNQIGYTTGVRFGLKKIEIKYYDPERVLTKKYSLVPARDKDGVICLYDEVNNKSYYPYNGTLDVYTGPVQPEPPVIPDVSILTNTYIKPSAGAIVPTDIKFTSLTNVTMHVKGFDNFEGESNLDSRAMIGAQPNFIVSPFTESNSSTNIGIYFKGCGNVLRSTDGNTPLMTMNGEHAITVGYDPMDINNINMANDIHMMKKISIDGQGESRNRVGGGEPIYPLVNGEMKTPICIFGNYNETTMKPYQVIALGYENALTQIGYVTGARYGVKQIDINARNADGSMTLKHSLVPARDSNGTICLYDEVNYKSYYPFHGTLDII